MLCAVCFGVFWHYQREIGKLSDLQYFEIKNCADMPDSIAIATVRLYLRTTCADKKGLRRTMLPDDEI